GSTRDLQRQTAAFFLILRQQFVANSCPPFHFAHRTNLTCRAAGMLAGTPLRLDRRDPLLRRSRAARAAPANSWFRVSYRRGNALFPLCNQSPRAVQLNFT